MPLVLCEYFQAEFAARLDADATDLPLEQAPYIALMAILPNEGDYIYATIRSSFGYETVKVARAGQGLYLVRGLCGTKAQVHPYGATIATPNPTIYAVLQDLTGNPPA